MTPVGIDIAKEKFDAAVLIGTGKYRSKVFANDSGGFAALLSWAARHAKGPLRVCMEATASYHEPLALFLADQGVAVSVVNPARLHAFAQSELSRTKTDDTDAKRIARFCALFTPPLWTPPAAEVRTLRELMRRLEALLDLHQQEANRLALASATTQDSIRAVLLTLSTEITRIKAAIRQHIDQHPGLKQRAALLDSIPGFGDTTIGWLLAEIDFAAFDDTKALSAFCGLAPRLCSSGSSVAKKARLAKTGAARLRRILYFPAITACQHNPLIRRFYQRLLANGKTKMQALCAAMRKLLALAYGVLKSGQPFNPNFAHGS